MSVRPALASHDGATSLTVTIASRTGFTARTRPRGVKLVVSGRRFVLRATGAPPLGRRWTTARLRGAQGAALVALAGRSAVIHVRTRAGTKVLRRQIAGPGTSGVVQPPSSPPAPPPASPPPVVPPQPQPLPQPQQPTPPGAPLGEQALAVAQRYLGTAYLWGGATPETGFDASGLTQYAYGQVGVTLPRVANSQIDVGTAVARESLQLGDLVFFQEPSGYVHHVGLFAGDSQFLHAPQAGDVIKYSSLFEPYYAGQFAGGRHIAG